MGTSRLADLIQEMADLLAGAGEAAWADWLADDAVRLRAGDDQAALHFLSAFGGMGSLNDLVLAPAVRDHFEVIKREALSLARRHAR